MPFSPEGELTLRSWEGLRGCVEWKSAGPLWDECGRCCEDDPRPEPLWDEEASESPLVNEEKDASELAWVGRRPVE